MTERYIHPRMIELANKGLTKVQIMKETGQTATQVHNQMAALTASGQIARVIARRGVVELPRHRVNRLRHRYNKPFGTIGQMLDIMPENQVAWLMDQIPEGGSLVDLLRAMVVDAYADR